MKDIDKLIVYLFIFIVRVFSSYFCHIISIFLSLYFILCGWRNISHKRIGKTTCVRRAHARAFKRINQFFLPSVSSSRLQTRDIEISSYHHIYLKQKEVLSLSCKEVTVLMWIVYSQYFIVIDTHYLFDQRYLSTTINKTLMINVYAKQMSCCR